MSLATIAVSANIMENELARVDDWTDGIEGVVQVERDDRNSVTVHFRDTFNEEASISASMDRAGSVALAYALLAAAEADE